MTSSGQHWENVYGSKRHDEVSWYQEDPALSLDLIERHGRPLGSVVDVGAGASMLVDRLLEAGHQDLTVVDVAAAALDVARQRLDDRAAAVTFVCADVLAWRPDRVFDVWHDRAVLHFLVDDDDRARYVATATDAVAPGGVLVVATFALDGPTHCSGLPVRRYDAPGLAAAFGPRVALVDQVAETHRTPWAAEQPFTWAVLRRLA